MAGMKLRDQFIAKLGTHGTAVLRLLPAETAHEIGIRILASPWFRNLKAPDYKINFNGLSTNIPGIGRCRHPVGLAAGFDKDARAPFGFSALGLSFLELGTVTPRPQPGNPKPRMFRQPDQHGLINRMGFNSEGSAAVLDRVQNLSRQKLTVPLGINIGKNRDTALAAALADYSTGLERFQHVADYFVINLSSPNTVGLRSLANEEFLSTLARRHPDQLGKIWLKLDPDTPKRDFQKLIESVSQLGFQGLVLTNTHKVDWPEAGGQSGHPLAVAATSRLEWAYEVHRGHLPMIASGGIFSGTDVIERLRRGACAVQIYSALVYRGPWAVAKILREVNAEMELQGITFLSDIQGTFFD
jgi:dihydroorotate dehydrogenase